MAIIRGMRSWIRAAFSFAILLICLPLPAAAAWECLASGALSICTDAGLSTAAATLSSLLDAAQVLGRQLRPWPQNLVPARVIVFRNAADFQLFRSSELTKGFYQSGADLDYILLVSGPTLPRAARHELVHRLLQRSAPPLPQWVEEGLAEYFSTLERRKDAVIAGLPIEEHRQVLARLPWLPAAQLAAVRSSAEIPAAPDARIAFYAQSWALVHFLMHEPSLQGRFAGFMDQMCAGRPAAEAFPASFGIPIEQALERLRAYLAQPALSSTSVPVEPSPAPASRPKALTQDEVTSLMGEIHLALGQWSEAHPYFEKLRDAGSTPAAKAAARLGFLALRDLNYESAEVQLKRALDLDSRDPGAWFEYAMLRRARAAPAQEVERHLRRTLELSPLYAEAWYFLASSLERRGALEEALAALEKATSLLPRQSPFWEARARLEWKLDRREPAVQSARQAVACARTPNETQMAEGLLRDFEEALQPPAPSRTRIATPPAWNPAPASASAEGLLTRIDCLDNSLLFHMRLTDGTVLLLRADGPASIRLEAESTPAEFSCGVLSAPRTVRVHYNPLPPGAAAAGTLIRLGFR